MCVEKCCAKKVYNLFLNENGGNEITKPGNYILCNSVDMVLGASECLLAIKASNVSLNLNNKSLNGTGDKTVKQNDSTESRSTGIKIDGGLTCIEIYNGCLSNFTVAGILSSVPDTNGLHLHDISLNTCGDRQLNYTDTGAVVLADPTYLAAAPPGNNYVIERISTHTSWGSAIILINYQKLSNVKIRDCSIVDFRGAQYAGFAELTNFDTPDRYNNGANASGIYTEGIIDNISIERVDLKHGIAEFNVVPVLHFSTLQNALISDVNVTDCVQNAVTNEMGPGQYYSFIQLQCIAFSNVYTQQSAEVLIRRCNVSNCYSNFDVEIGSTAYSALSYASTVAFYIQGPTDCRMEDCRVEEFTSNGIAYPVAFGSSHSGDGPKKTWSLDNCHAFNVSSVKAPAFGFWLEIGQQASTEAICLNNCSVENLTSGTGYTANPAISDYPAAYSWLSPTTATDDTIVLENLVMQNCRAKHIRNASGIYVGTKVNRSTIQECILQDINDVACYVAGGTAGSGYLLDTLIQDVDTGIYLQDGTKSWTVQNNKVLKTTSNGIKQDNTGDLNSYLRNEVQTNANHYVSLPANTPIRTWTIGSSPSASVAGPNIDNLSIS